MLTRDSLDQFSGSGKGARRLGSLVLTSLCSVTGPERRPKETGETSSRISLPSWQGPQQSLIALCGLSFHQVCGQSLCLAGNTASASALRARQRQSAGGWHFVK